MTVIRDSKTFKLPRRAFLRGLGGIAIGLPALEIMLPRGASALPGRAPQRYMIGVAGISISGYADQGVGIDRVVPTNTGTGYDMTIGLQPIADLGIQDHVSIVSGLKIPWEENGVIPAGGRRYLFHAWSLAPLISGVRSQLETEAANGETSDRIVARTIAGDTAHDVLHFRVQAAYYRGDNGNGGARGRISYRNDNGQIIPDDPIVDPYLAFQSLFSTFVPPDPGEAAAAEFLLRRRRSIVDMVADDTEALLPKLGAADKIRMERHLDELRGLEMRLEQTELPTEGACMVPEQPKQDWPIGGAVENGDTEGYAEGGAYSDEETRAEILTDLVAMAFACDLSRVGAIMYTMAQCFLNAQPLFQAPSDFHEIGHYSLGGGIVGAEGMARCVAWHVRHWGRLVQKLDSMIDLDGSTILDNTAMALVFEGGYGYDPEGGTEVSSHSTENMIALIAGKAGGLNAAGGQHLVVPDGHPGQVINTAMAAVGVEEQLGEVSGTIDGLIG